MLQLGGFLGRLLERFLKTGLPLIEKVLKPLAKSVLIPVGLTTPASATDAANQKKSFGSGTALIISNEEMDNIIKIVKSFKESGLLIKDVSETIKNETKEQKVCFMFWSNLILKQDVDPRSMFYFILLDTLGASLVGNSGQVEEYQKVVKDLFQQVKQQIELVKIYYAASSFN